MFFPAMTSPEPESPKTGGAWRGFDPRRLLVRARLSLLVVSSLVAGIAGFEMLETSEPILGALALGALLVSLWLAWFIGRGADAAHAQLADGEARFRSLSDMSSDFYWESDIEHRLTQRASANRKLSTVSAFQRGAQIGERRWEIPYLTPDEAGWQAHRAVLDAHRPFRDFELSRLGADGTERHISISGDPVFDASGAFKGYRGVGRDITERKNAESALRESEARFRLTFELAGSGIAHVSLDGRFLRVNRSLCAILGYSDKELLERTVKELSHAEDRDKSDAERARVRSGELESTRLQKRYLRKDGATVWVDLTVALVRDAEGKPLYEIAVFDDDTERKKAESALRESVDKLRLFADNVPSMTVSYDENLRCLFANRRYADFFGISPANIIGKHLREIVGEQDYREIEVHFAQVLQGHPVTYQRTRKLPNGEPRYIEVKLLPHVGDRGKVLGCFAVTTDITEHKLTEERIQRVAHHDGLTGLPNQLLFNDRLSQAISLAKRDSHQFALLYLDLDKFKPVNDALGHSAGDELLKAVATRIRQLVRESDTVARIGGDEFTVILRDIARREEAETVARKIIAAVATPFQLGSQKHSVGIGTSIGIAIYPADARDADGLVKAADSAMYSAKQAGNSFRFCAA